MPFLHFVDKELTEEMEKIPKNNNNQEERLEEHQFIATCLKIGLRIDDLKELQYKDVAKIMLCFIGNQGNSKKATQADIDKLLG